MINPWEWSNKPNKPKTPENPQNNDNINNSNSFSPDTEILTEYNKTIIYIHELIKDKIDAGLSKEEAFDEVFTVLKGDVLNRLNKKFGRDRKS